MPAQGDRMTPEARARLNIDKLLGQAGWHVCDVGNANIRAATGVAIREFPLDAGHGFADYLLYVNGKACGVIEAKKEGATLSGVEVQSARYAQGLPATLPAWRRPLPFVFESTGVETRFTNGLDPHPQAQGVDGSSWQGNDHRVFFEVRDWQEGRLGVVGVLPYLSEHEDQEVCMNDRTLCPICGAGHVADHVEQVETEYKGRKGQVPSHFQLCDACGSDMAGAAQMRANKRAVMAFRKQVDGLLSGAEIAALRER
jgi:hypothetical protein